MGKKQLLEKRKKAKKIKAAISSLPKEEQENLFIKSVIRISNRIIPKKEREYWKITKNENMMGQLYYSLENLKTNRTVIITEDRILFEILIILKEMKQNNK